MAKSLVKYSVVTSKSNLKHSLSASSFSFFFFLENNFRVDNQVDAFTDSPFKGNQAAVCLLDEERDDHWLQSVAAEFNLSETAFLTRLTESEPRDSLPRFRLRWFTPVDEVSSKLFYFSFGSFLIGFVD